MRLSLLWARKGGMLRQRPMFASRLLPSQAKRIGRHTDRIHFGERQLSFDETPVFRFNMHRLASMRHFNIPCIRPEVDSDDDNDSSSRRRTFFSRDVNEDYDQDEDDNGRRDRSDSIVFVCEEEEEEEEEEAVDAKAEEFIAEFYEQMKLQRQISWLEYNEMLHRSLS